MKNSRLLFWAASFYLLLPIYKSFALPEPFPNLLVNGSFEESTENNENPNGWQVKGKTGFVQRSTGQRAIFLSGTAEDPDVSLVQRILVPESKPLAATLSALVKTKDVSELHNDAHGYAVINVSFFGKDGGTAGKPKELGRWEGSMGWRGWSGRIRIPDGAAELELRIELKGSTGKIFIDEVRVFWGFPDDYARDNLLVDGGFEFPHPLSPWKSEPGCKWRYPGIEGQGVMEARLEAKGRAAAFQEIIFPETRSGAFLEIQLLLRVEKVQSLEPGGGARIEVRFLDKNEDSPGTKIFGPWTGTKTLENFRKRIRVPKRAVKAVFRFVLENAKGAAFLDEARVAYVVGDDYGLRPLEFKTETGTWKTFKPLEGDMTGALDASDLLDAPAGKHGFLKAGPDGHFYFEDGTRARFFGINLQPPAALPSHDDAVRFAQRLSQLGFNLVRLHHLDARWAEPYFFDQAFDDTQHFSAEALDRLDYFIAELKKRGIYIYLDLLVSRKFKKGDGVQAYLKFTRDTKTVAQFDPRIIELQKKFANDLWKHENPYTGNRLVDEPAIVLTEIANENSLCRFAKKDKFFEWPVYYLNQIQDLWVEYKKKQGKTGEAVQAKGYLNLDDPDVRKFFAGIQEKYFQEMDGFLKTLGLKIPVAGSNLPLDGWDLEINSRLDFVDRHSYWDPPQGGYGDLVRIHNQLITREVTPRHLTTDPKRINPITRLSALRVAGKPFVVGEWNIDWPNEYRAAGPLLMAAYASFQDWDAVIQFNFEGSLVPQKIEGNFDIGTKPEILLQIPLAARLFYERHISPALKSDQFSFFSGESISPGLGLLHRVERSGQKDSSFAPKIQPDQNWISDTKELRWNEKKGLVKIVTLKTQAIIGLMPRDSVQLKDVAFQSANLFAVLGVSSMDGQAISSARQLLLSAVGRAENAGTVYNATRTFLRSSGKGPILMEPVLGEAVLNTGERGTPKVFLLDPLGGRIREVTIAVQDASVRIPLQEAGAYEIIWEKKT